MLIKSVLSAMLVVCLAWCCTAQEPELPQPDELEVLKGFVGNWDANIEIWPEGPDAPSIKFKGTEVNRAFGDYWVASDFVSEYMGQTMKVHSVVGYDLDQKKLVGTIVDHGPYAATMTGIYDPAKKTVQWKTLAKTLDGTPMEQMTSITQNNADERVLILSVPGKDDDFTRFMQINFTRQK